MLDLSLITLAKGIRQLLGAKMIAFFAPTFKWAASCLVLVYPYNLIYPWIELLMHFIKYWALHYSQGNLTFTFYWECTIWTENICSRCLKIFISSIISRTITIRLFRKCYNQTSAINIISKFSFICGIN